MFHLRNLMLFHTIAAEPQLNATEPLSLDLPKRMPVPEVAQPSRLQRLWGQE
jgi:hypothetical protein